MVTSRRLATKFSLAMALLVTVSLGIMSLLAVTVSRESLRQQVLAANLTAATLGARAVEQYVADTVSIMREASGRPKLSHEVRTGNWAEARKVLENFLRHFNQFDYVFLQDPDGIIRARVPHAETVGQDFSFRDFFQEARRTRRDYISGVYTSKAAQRPVVSIAVPLLDAGDTVTGVLVGALSLKAMSGFVAGIGQEDKSLVSVVDAKGALIAHSGSFNPGGLGMVAPQPIVQALLAGRPGTMEFQDPERGEHFLAAHVPIARFGWGVVVERPRSLAYAPSDRLARWLLWPALGCTAIAILVGFGLARTLTRPLLGVAEATGKLAKGDFAVRVAVQGRDEVATLATSFNTMAAELEASYLALEQRTKETNEANDALVREIAERRHVEQEVRRLNEELEQRVVERTGQLEGLNRELEAFTYTVSHDLKAPLRGMEGFARAMQEDYADRLDGTGTRYLDMIRTSARRMGELIDDLLRYSRLERREMKREPVALRPLLERVCEEREEEIRARGLTVRVELGVEAVEAEREGLREALANLVENAVKFSRDTGGTITVGSRQEDTGVVLSVADAGTGFDMKYHDRIFQIFERLHRQEEYAGTGVGLAIVRKVAERHGGRAWAESEPGKGSTFYLALPASAGGHG